MTPPAIPSVAIDHQKRSFVAARPAPAKNAAVPGHIAIAVDSMHCESAPAFRKPLSEAVNVCLHGGVRWLSVLVPANAEAALAEFIAQEAEPFSHRGVKLAISGEHASLEDAADVLRRLPVSRESLRFSFAVNYGGRGEIVDAVRALATQVRAGALRAADVDMPRLEEQLCAGDLPPVDLLVRTGGSTALSDFLLWKAAYAELLFVDERFRDFSARQMQVALDDYARRRRTFGGLSARAW